MFLWDVLFPRRCLICGGFGSYLCLDCSKSLKMVENQTCLYCGSASRHGLTHPGCRRENGIDGRISLYHYDARMKKFIAGFKYRLVKDALPDLSYLIGRRAGFLTGAVRDLGFPAIAPIPLSARRKNERGFNQAEIISRIITVLLPLPRAALLARAKDTSPQATLSGLAKRRSNIRGAFVLKKDYSLPDRVMVVDDVITTGETVKEAARVLKKAGVRKVYALSVAKG